MDENTTQIADTSAPATPVATEMSAAPVAAPTTSAPAASTAPNNAAAAAAPAPVVEYFEAMVDGQPFQIPKSAQFPWKRGDESGFHTLAEITESPYLKADYTRKMQELGEQRRQVLAAEGQNERIRVEMEARREAANTARQRLIEAQAKGGEALERELRHQELMETDEEYRERFSQSEEYRIDQRMRTHDAEVDRVARTESAVTRARDYIGQACAKHPGLDPKHIEAVYSMALQTGRADLTEDAVDAIIAEEVRRGQQLNQPLQTELDGLKKQVAELTAQLSANGHNANTSAAIARATGSQPGKPANGNPPAPQRALKPFDPNGPLTEAQWKRAWLNEGVTTA